MPNILIAFDPGKNLGYSVWHIEKYSRGNPRKGLLESGYSNAPKKESPDSKVMRIVGVATGLREKYQGRIIRIISEEIFYPRDKAFLAKSAAACQEINGMLKAVFVGIIFQQFPPVRWQSALLSGVRVPATSRKTQKGQTKEKSRALVKTLLKLEVTNPEEGDAICLGMWYLDQLE